MRIRKDKNFLSFFDEKNGNYIRTGIIKDGKDTGTDPFMASFPELLDVGIMGHCKHGKSGLCIKSGVECYQDGLHSEAANMRIDDFESIANQCKGKTFQFALGGCGDPDQHERFAEILEICYKNKIVPNFTTSGLGLTEELARICKKYCGAVAVSWYRSEYTLRAIDLLIRNSVKTNIHYVLQNNTIDEALERLKEKTFPAGINAIIFLLHKPIGLGSERKIVKMENPAFQKFIDYVSSSSVHYKIGFDSCTVPALLQNPGAINLDSLDTCEGTRWSAYVTADYKLLPCSFDNQEQKWAVDLHKYTIQEAWNSRMFEDFRNHFRQSCPECKNKDLCLGGCPICPQIVLCSNKRNNRLGKTAKIKTEDEYGSAKKFL